MTQSMKEYDGTLAVACIVLAVVLNALQISYITDGLVMISGQDYVLATMFAVVISTGLMYSIFAAHRLSEKHMMPAYSWTLAILASLLTGGMAAMSLTHTAGLFSARWCFGVLLGLSIPAQTIVLCNMTNGMLDLAGSGWWNNSLVKKMLSLVLPDTARATLPQASEASSLVVPEVKLDVPAATPAPSVVTIQPAETLAKDLPNSEPALPKLEPKPVEAKLETSTDLASVHKPEVSASSAAPQTEQTVVSNDVRREVPVHTPAVTSAPLVVRQVLPGAIAGQSAIDVVQSGDRISVRVRRDLSKRKWKDLHSELRRVQSVIWDNASNAVSEVGGRDRMLNGVILVPERKGKKNKKKREGARLRHLESVKAEVQNLVKRYAQ